MKIKKSKFKLDVDAENINDVETNEEVLDVNEDEELIDEEEVTEAEVEETKVKVPFRYRIASFLCKLANTAEDKSFQRVIKGLDKAIEKYENGEDEFVLDIDENGNLINVKTGNAVTTDEAENFFNDDDDEIDEDETDNDEAEEDAEDTEDVSESGDANSEADTEESVEESTEGTDDLITDCTESHNSPDVDTLCERIEPDETDILSTKVADESSATTPTVGDATEENQQMTGETNSTEDVEAAVEDVESSAPADCSVHDEANLVSIHRIKATEQASATPVDDVPRIRYEIPVLGDFVKSLDRVADRKFKTIADAAIAFTKERDGEVATTGDPYTLDENGTTAGSVVLTIGRQVISLSQSEVFVEGKKYRHVEVLIGNVNLPFVAKYDKKKLALNTIGIPNSDIDNADTISTNGKSNVYFKLSNHAFDVNITTICGKGKNEHRARANIEVMFFTDITDTQK